ncbi:MAG: carbohydrate kinase family protein [Burkholderiales bacterium]|nr:carbohydrate kinase family protein [Anaerolineae bacterium]
MNIVVTGSIAYDYLMRFPGRFAEHLIGEQLHQVSLSFLVDEMTKQWGGVAPNIVYSLSLLGLRPKLMGTVGRDFGDYRTWLEQNGVDLSAVRQHEDVFTASFFANTDLDNNQMSSFYTGAMARARDYTLAEACPEPPDLVVISPNDPIAMMQLTEECRTSGIRFVYDPSQQVPRLQGDELRRSMQGAYAMVVNAYEAEIIGSKTGLTIDDMRGMIEILVITQGPRGSHIYVGDKRIDVDSFPTDKIVDPTGAGDAYRAGLLRAITAGLPLDVAGQMGALCATYVLEKVGTQNHRFTVPEFIARYRTQFDDKGELDRLLTDHE